MTREHVRIATSVVLATVTLGIALGIRPVSTERILSAYLLVLAAIMLAALTRIARSASERPESSQFEAALEPRPALPARPPELVRTEREILLGAASAGHLHLRLLPLLRETAAAHNIDLVGRPDAARALLGEDAWELLRPDRAEPEDRNAPGIRLAQVGDVIDRLEAL